MANKKSLQQGGAPEVRNNLEYLLSELQDKIQNQNIPVQQSVADLVSEGNNPQEIAQALLQIGYKEEDIKQIFNSLPTDEESSEVKRETQQQPQQQQAVEQPQMQQENMQQMQQEGVTAKKGKEMHSPIYDIPKAKQGMGFRDWMRQAGRHGSINQNQMYQAPEARYLPMQKESYSAMDAMKNIGSNLMDFIDKTKTWNDNKEHLYNYKANVPEGVDIDDYATNIKELYRSATENKELRTNEQLKEEMLRRSRMSYDPKMGYVSSFADPYSTDKQIKKGMKKKFGANYMKRSVPINDFQGLDYDQSQAIVDYMYNKYRGNMPRGTKLGMDQYGMPTYQVGPTDYDIMLGKKKFNTTQDNAMNDLYNRRGATLDWVKQQIPNIEYGNAQRKPYWNGSYWEGAHPGSRNTPDYGWDNKKTWIWGSNKSKQLGGGTHNTYYAQTGQELLTQDQWVINNPAYSLSSPDEVDAAYQKYLASAENAFGIEPDGNPQIKPTTYNFVPPEPKNEYSDEQVGNYLDFSQDLSGSNLVNKGSMGKQPNFDISNSGDPDKDGITNYNSPCTGPNCAPTATITNKGWGDFRKGLGKFGDVAEASVNITGNVNKFLKSIDNDKQLGDITHQSADGIHGIDNPEKGFWTYQQEGILQPDHQTEYMAQKGAELYKAQIGIPPLFDNTKKEKPVVYTLDEEKYKANQDSTKMHNLTLKQMEAFPMVGSFRNPQADFSEKRYIEKLGSGKSGVHFDLDHFKESGKASQADLDFIKEIQASGVQPAYYKGTDPLSDTIKQTKEWQGLDPIADGTSWNPYYPEPQVEMKFGHQPQDVKTIKARTTPDSKRSVVDRMVEMGMDPSFEKRKGWYEANFPNEDYRGSKNQNKLLNEWFTEQSKIRAKTGVELPKYQKKGELFPYSGPEEKAGYGNYWQTIYNNAQKLHKQKMLGDASYRLEQGNIDNKKYLVEPELYGDPRIGEFIAMYQDGKRVPREQLITDPNKLREFIGLRQEDKMPWLDKFYPDIKSTVAERIKQPGGQINPFSQKKRQLRKRTGGQVANISTEVLKRLQATNGAKFDIL